MCNFFTGFTFSTFPANVTPNKGYYMHSKKFNSFNYSKTCLKWPLKNRQNKGLNGKWELNEGQKYSRMLQVFEHSAILNFDLH